MRVEVSVVVDAPPERVWEVVRDPVALGALDAGLLVEPDPDGPDAGMRARYRAMMRVGPVPVGGDVEVVEWVPCRELAWTSLTGIDQRFRLRLRAGDEGRTKLTVRFGYIAAGPFGTLADLVAFGRVRATLVRLLDEVRAAAEAAPDPVPEPG